MPPQKALQWAVGVGLFVSCVMMQAMPRRPYSRRLLHAARAQYGQRALHPPRAGKAAVRQKPMVPDIHSEPAENVVPEHREHDPGPTEEPGKARKERHKMDENNRRGVPPLDGPRAGRCRCRQMTTTASQRVVVHEPSESPAPSPNIVEAQHLFAVTHFLGHGLGQVAHGFWRLLLTRIGWRGHGLWGREVTHFGSDCARRMRARKLTSSGCRASVGARG